MKGIPQHIFPTAFSSHPSAPLSICGTTYKVLDRSSSFIIFPFLKVVLETIFLRLGLKHVWQGLCAMLSHSIIFHWDFSLTNPHGIWFQDLMKLRLLMSHCKNSVRDTPIGKRWIFFRFRENHTPQSVSHHRGQVQWPWHVVWLVFYGLGDFIC